MLFVIGLIVCPKQGNAIELNIVNTINEKTIINLIPLAMISFGIYQMIKNQIHPVHILYPHSSKNNINNLWTGHDNYAKDKKRIESDFAKASTDREIETNKFDNSDIKNASSFCGIPKEWEPQIEERDDSHMNYLYRFENLYI